MNKSTKQVIIIRRDLKCRRGKEIAQGAHASMAFLTRRIQKSLATFNSPYPPMNDAEREWIMSSFRKITCQVPDLESLLEIQEKAKEAGLEAHLVEDTGHTEFNGVKTITCLAIGPDFDENIDPVTKGLKLY